jgi:hypothetical protein
VQRGTPREERREEVAERVRRGDPVAVAAQANAAVDVPREDEDRALRAFGRRRERREVHGAVHEERDAPGGRAPPAAASLDRDARTDTAYAVSHGRSFRATLPC